MLTTLAMLVCMQLPMRGICEGVNMKAVVQPEVVVKTVVKEVPVTVTVTKKVYVYIDKFGVEHEGENKTAVYNEVYLENQKPFQMKDSEGRLWQHQDKATLEKFINERNAQIEANRRPAFMTRPAPSLEQPVYITPQAFNFGASVLNCSPVG